MIYAVSPTSINEHGYLFQAVKKDTNEPTQSVSKSADHKSNKALEKFENVQVRLG